MSDSRVVVVISDDEEDEQQQVMAEVGDEVQEEDADLPYWLPDGWGMEVYRTDDGTIKKYYISPVSGRTFTMESEVVEYLFKGTDERILQAKEAAEKNPFLRKYEGLPKGWLLEIRAGGKNMDKMYKILETVDVNPDELPKGWVRGDIFRMTKRGVQKISYYTEPVSHYTFHTLKSAIHYAETGKIVQPRVCTIDRKMSVYDVCSFSKSADLHESLCNRLTWLMVNDGQETGLLPIDEDDASHQRALKEHDEETSTEAKDGK